MCGIPSWIGLGGRDLGSSAEGGRAPRPAQDAQGASPACAQMQLVFAIFQEAGVIRRFGIVESVLAHFIANVAVNYHNTIPYHNLVRGQAACASLLARL